MATLGYCHTYLPRKRDDVILLTDFHVDSTQDQGSMAISFDGNKKVAEWRTRLYLFFIFIQILTSLGSRFVSSGMSATFATFCAACPSGCGPFRSVGRAMASLFHFTIRPCVIFHHALLSWLYHCLIFRYSMPWGMSVTFPPYAPGHPGFASHPDVLLGSISCDYWKGYCMPLVYRIHVLNSKNRTVYDRAFVSFLAIWHESMVTLSKKWLFPMLPHL